MKKKSFIMGRYFWLMVIGSFMVACGNSQKKKEEAMVRKMIEQPKDTVTITESETIVVIDTLSSDTTNLKSKAGS